jgi:hypothetical protein
VLGPASVHEHDELAGAGGGRHMQVDAVDPRQVIAHGPVTLLRAARFRASAERHERLVHGALQARVRALAGERDFDQALALVRIYTPLILGRGRRAAVQTKTNSDAAAVATTKCFETCRVLPPPSSGAGETTSTRPRQAGRTAA